MIDKSKRHNLFLALVIPLSVPFYLLNLFYRKGILIDLPISFLMILVPFILSVYFTFQDNGKDGIRGLLVSSHKVRKGSLCWILISLLLMPLAFTLAAFIDNDFSLHIYRNLGSKDLLIFFLLYLGAFLEEVGWTTFLTEDMQKDYGILDTGIRIGLIWGLWHLIPYISQGRSVREIVFLISLSVLYRIIMGYLFHYSSFSSLTGILFHTMINFVPETMVRIYDTFRFSTLTAVLCVFLIGFWAFNRYGYIRIKRFNN